jgi:hypothetical protein
MVVAPGSGSIATRRTFEDLFVHLEYKTPALPANVTGQDRGNSGLYLNNRYALQILDSFGLAPADDGCGAIYQLRHRERPLASRRRCGTRTMSSFRRRAVTPRAISLPTRACSRRT